MTAEVELMAAQKHCIWDDDAPLWLWKCMFNNHGKFVKHLHTRKCLVIPFPTPSIRHSTAAKMIQYDSPSSSSNVIRVRQYTSVE